MLNKFVHKTWEFVKQKENTASKSTEWKDLWVLGVDILYISSNTKGIILYTKHHQITGKQRSSSLRCPLRERRSDEANLDNMTSAKLHQTKRPQIKQKMAKWARDKRYRDRWHQNKQPRAESSEIPCSDPSSEDSAAWVTFLIWKPVFPNKIAGW